jgi:acetolactate synthase-1/2/3 large subunit
VNPASLATSRQRAVPVRDFTNPGFVAYAKSLGVKGFRVSAAAQLLPTLRRALAGDSVSLVVCPVDYSENLALTKMLGEITDPF